MTKGIILSKAYELRAIDDNSRKNQSDPTLLLVQLETSISSQPAKGQ